jgi:hypothetical protein
MRVVSRALQGTILAGLASASPALAQTSPQTAAWDALPRMQLERQYAGPLRDTIVQRWRDPDDGTTCYVYLPITAQHSQPTPSGFVQYGANTIGSISCFARNGAPPQPAARPAPAR